MRVRDRFDRFLLRTASGDHPSKVIRSWRVMGFPCCYCVVVVGAGILTLLLRVVYPHGSGATYDGVDGSNAVALAILLALPLCYAFIEPHGGAFLFVCLTAVVRCTDALRPLSLAPFVVYVALVPCQLAIWCRVDIVPAFARLLRRRGHATER